MALVRRVMTGSLFGVFAFGGIPHIHSTFPRAQALVEAHPSCMLSFEEGLDHFKSRLGGWAKGRESRLTHHFGWLCKKYRIDPSFVSAVIEVESAFQPGVVSPMGAVGLMQLMPDTARYVLNRQKSSWQSRESIEKRLKDPFFNLSLGIAYLSELAERYGGNLNHSLVAYNAGPKRMDDVLNGVSRPLRVTDEYLQAVWTARWARNRMECSGGGRMGMQLTPDDLGI